jgi:hypothetical protein
VAARELTSERRLAVLIAVAIGLAACAGPIGSPASSAKPESSPHDPSFSGPPPVIVRGDGVTHELRAWTFCYAVMCADGSPPQDPPDIGTTDAVEIEFPLTGWTFDATFEPAAQACPRKHTVDTEPTGPTTHLLRPAGHADTYDVTLAGWGDGDLFVTFRWTTTSDGPMPVPAARLAVLADHDGVVDSYGVELELSNLAETPDEALAEITVTAANGDSITFEATRTPDCWAEGLVYWDGPDIAGLDAAELGPGPFTYDVTVTLDGVEYVAHATWPDDQIDGNEPSVALEFTPRLPALR